MYPLGTDEIVTCQRRRELRERATEARRARQLLVARRWTRRAERAACRAAKARDDIY